MRRVKTVKTTSTKLMIVAISLVLVVYTGSTLAAPPLPASLKTVDVPLPADLDLFVQDRDAAIRLGKALFWDMQVGSRGTQACATCHYHAGVDNRFKGDFHPNSNGTFDIGGPNHKLSPDDFPFHRLSDVDDHESTVIHSFDDISGAQGLSLGDFTDVDPGSALDIGLASPDSTFNVAGKNIRQVTGRNAPSTINAIFNFANFLDGRANNLFNGENPFGAADPSAGIWVNNAGDLVKERVLLENSSTASQAVGPPLSGVEMSFRGRTFPKLGRKMLSLTPLGKQLVHRNDSVLGLLSAARLDPEDRGLVIDYITMIKSAYRSKYWDSDKILTFDTNGVTTVGSHPGRDLTTDEFTQMEANFSFFFGLSIEVYESTLVSDETPFDRFREGDDCALTEQQLEGLETFRNQGSCLNCHFGPEFTGASVNHVLGLIADIAGFTANLAGDEEVPPVDTPATGLLDSDFNEETRELDVELGVEDIDDPGGLAAISAAHIHLGAAGTNGPIIFTLFQRNVDGFFDTPLLVTLTAANFEPGSGLADFEEAIQRMRAGETYVNVHTDAHPGGEIRGQIIELPEVEQPVEFMNMAQGRAFYDNGFYNISVTPTAEDIGRGGTDPFGFPLSFSRLAMLKAADDLPDHLAPFVFDLPGIVEIPDQRVAVDGAFKVPGLRNVELTGPYMHNGGMQTLIQVVQFYTRGGNFPEVNIDNLDPDINEIGRLRDHPDRQNAVVAFLKSLTDERVRWEMAPFDHPQLFVAHGSKGDSTQVVGDPDTVGPLGFAESEDFFEVPPVGAEGRSAEGLPPLGLYLQQPFNILVVDNQDPLASFAGTWQVASSEDSYQEDFRLTSESGAEATFKNPPVAPLSNPYTVSLWWTAAADRSTAVTVQIFDGDVLEDTFLVDQTQDGGLWNALGSFEFTDQPIVKIVSNGSGSVSADAVRFAPSSLEEMIIDNRDPGTSTTGLWRVSGGADPYGQDSVFSRTRAAKFTFEAALNNRHGVFIRWTAFASRPSSVPVEIWDGATLLETVIVDQTRNASIWNTLGSFNFNGAAKIVVVSEGSNLSTSADAVRFIKTTGAPHVVDHIQIVGPTTIVDNSRTGFAVRLFYRDGASEEVAADSWTVEDPNATISASGTLMVDDLDADKTIVIRATFNDGICQLHDTHKVKVVDDGIGAEVIIDNLDPGALATGTWLVSGGANPFGVDSVYSRTTGDTFAFSADLVPGVQYAVFMWWTTWPSRRTNLPVEIYSGSTLLDTVNVNQKINGGQWNLLGFHTFSAAARVRLTAASGFSTNADAVRFIPVSQLTEILIDNRSPGTSSTGTWRTSGGVNPVGDDSVWSRTAGDTFTFEIGAVGTFTVSAWWTSWPSRSDNVMFEIIDGTTVLDTVFVDQTMNAGQWNQLGAGSFSFSIMPSVRITVTGNDTSTNADAIRFIPVN